MGQAVEAAQAKAAVVNQYEGQWEHNQRQGFGVSRSTQAILLVLVTFGYIVTDCLCLQRLTHLDGTAWAGEWFADEKQSVPFAILQLRQ